MAQKAPKSFHVVMIEGDDVVGIVSRVVHSTRERPGDDIEFIEHRRREEALEIMNRWYLAYFAERGLRLMVRPGPETY